MPYLNVTQSLYLLINDSPLRGVHGKTGGRFRGRRGSGTQGRVFRKRGGSPHGQQDVFAGQPGAAGPDPDARYPGGDGCRARPDHRARVPCHRCAFRPGRERPDRGALPGARRALQQRGRQPGDVVIPAMTMGARSRSRSALPVRAGGLPVPPAGDRKKVSRPRCDDCAPAPVEGNTQGEKTTPAERRGSSPQCSATNLLDPPSGIAGACMGTGMREVSRMTGPVARMRSPVSATTLPT